MFARQKRLIYSVSIVIFIVLTAFFIPRLRNQLIEGLYWPLRFFSYISREVQGIILYHKNLVENQQLENEIGLIKRQLHEAEELYFENERLRQLLDFKERAVYPLTAASVISQDPSNLSLIITIDKGKNQGISSDCAVITNNGLVGRVVQVGKKTSKVLLINDINSGVAAFVQRSRQKGLVSGTLGRGLILQYLPSDADIQVNDLVITSGLSDLYPKGISIGIVKEIYKEETSGEIKALIEPSVDLTKLEEVLVVIKE